MIDQAKPSPKKPARSALPSPTKTQLREFGWLMAGVFGGIFGAILPLWKKHPIPTWPWIIAVPCFVLAAIAPMALGPVYKVWMKIGQVLGFINTRIILALVFFVIMVPISLILRALGKDPLRLRLIATAEKSYRITRDQKIAPGDMEVPY